MYGHPKCTGACWARHLEQQRQRRLNRAAHWLAAAMVASGLSLLGAVSCAPVSIPV